MIILIIIYYQSINHSEKDTFQHKLFIKIIVITFVILIVDIFSRCDGNLDTIYPILNYWGNLIVFLLNPILPSMWLKYTHYQIFQNETKTKKLIYPILVINFINVIMVILTQYFRYYYYIDSLNIYHRGPFFLLAFAITTIILFSSLILTIINRHKIEKKYYLSLLFFAIPLLIGLVLQVRFYGVSLILPGVTISILIVFLNIQNHSIYTDYLTGVYNRNKLEIYIEDKIRMATEESTFSAIMIDLDDFKYINDTFGHDMGDNALRGTVELLKACIRSKDFIARYGGDEFWIILETCNITDLENIVNRMKSAFEIYNESNNKPYKLLFSCGYGVYDCNKNMNVSEFQKHIDDLMYENKKMTKELR